MYYVDSILNVDADLSDLLALEAEGYIEIIDADSKLIKLLNPRMTSKGLAFSSIASQIIRLRHYQYRKAQAYSIEVNASQADVDWLIANGYIVANTYKHRHPRSNGKTFFTNETYYNLTSAGWSILHHYIPKEAMPSLDGTGHLYWERAYCADAPNKSLRFI